MEEVKRIYSLLLHSNGLNIREIASELDLDKYHVAEVMFSTQNIPYWFQDDSSLWFAKEGALRVKDFLIEKLSSSASVSTKTDIEKLIEQSSSDSLNLSIKSYINSSSYSDEEIRELFILYHKGNLKAYELLVKSQQSLVLETALFYKKNRRTYIEDLIQEGNIGLLKAIERYNYRRFNNFPFYAKIWITQAISFSATCLPYPIRLPINKYNDYCRVKKFINRYKVQFGYAPSLDEIELFEDIDYQQIEYLYNLPDALNELVSSVDDLEYYESYYPSPDAKLLKESQHYDLEYLLAQVQDRNADIIRLYYGLSPYKKEYSLEEIAREYNLTRERVRQIKEKTIRILRDIAHYPISYLIKSNSFDDIKRQIKNVESPLLLKERRESMVSIYKKRMATYSYESPNNSWYRSIVPDKALFDLLYPDDNRNSQKPNRIQQSNIVHYDTKGLTVKNEGRLCYIYKNEELVYFSFGTIKKIKGVFYRFILSSSFYVNIIEKRDYGLIATDHKIIEAHSWTHLFKELSPDNLANQIENIWIDPKTENYTIKVNGVWYDCWGGFADELQFDAYGNLIKATVVHEKKKEEQIKSQKEDTSHAIRERKHRMKKKREITALERYCEPKKNTWCPQKERDLLSFYKAGVEIEQLARIFETSPSIIQDKLSHLK